jgi:predicted alpha/beta-fold hydrolase
VSELTIDVSVTPPPAEAAGSAPSSKTAARSTFAPPPFVPGRGLGNGHVMTVFAWAKARTFPALPAPDTRLFRVATDSQVLARCYWQPERAGRPTLVALHGLEGSSDVRYMRGLAEKAWRRGWNAVLLNQRNCGGTEHLTPTLYHSGLTDDPRAVIRALVAENSVGDVGVVGYSLGGNLTMKLAGELRETPDLPVRAIVGVCPTIDLDRCVRAIERPVNLLYQLHFVRNLRQRMRRKAETWPEAFDLSRLNRIWTIRAFDDAYTAPSHGFGDAANYYHRASAMRVVDRIAIPALILAAGDDPFVPASQFLEPAVRDNPHIQVAVSAHGGHCAFVALTEPGEDAFWAESTAIEFLARAVEHEDP